MTSRSAKGTKHTTRWILVMAMAMLALPATAMAAVPHAPPPELLPIEAAAQADQPFVYVNTPVTTGMRHTVPLRISVDDPYTGPVFQAHGVPMTDIWWVRVWSADFIGESKILAVEADATQASRPTAHMTAYDVALADGLVRIESNCGAAHAMFTAGQSQQQFIDRFNTAASLTGVWASADAANVLLESRYYGSDAFLQITRLDGAVFTTDAYHFPDTFTDYATGTDAVIWSIDGSADGLGIDGILASVDRPDLQLDFVLNDTFAGTTQFTIERHPGSDTEQTYTTSVTRGGPEAFETTNVNPLEISSITVANAVFAGDSKTISWNADATTASKARCDMQAPYISQACGTVHIEGNLGIAEVTFTEGTTQSEMVAIVNAVSEQTGVEASPYEDDVRFKSAEYGLHQFVRFTRIDDAVFSLLDDCDYGANATVTAVDDSATGVDVEGLHVVVSRPDLQLEFDFADATVNQSAGSFTIQRTDDGTVTLEPTADPLVWNIVGGLQGTATPGTVLLNVEVTGSPSGQSDITQASVQVRRLGDVNGDTIVDTEDRLAIDRFLNGIPTEQTPETMDLNADGVIDTQDKLILIRLLNGMIVP